MKVTIGLVSLFLAVGCGAAFDCDAAGGTIALRTDGTADGYFFGLGGSGVDRFINEYPAGTLPPGSVICGARVLESNHGSSPRGVMGGEIRAEDPGLPGYPDLVAPPIATADPASTGECSSGGVPRIFTFGGGLGVAPPPGSHFVCAIEPVHGPAPLDFCGVLIDTNGPNLGVAKYYSGGTFGALPWNIFVEEIVFTPGGLGLRARASGSARFPGDRGVPVVYTTRPNAAGAVTDDRITLSMAFDNGTGAPLSRNITICADPSVVGPGRARRPVTGFFTPVGGGAPIVNPVVLPAGRTILRLEVASPVALARIARFTAARPVNLPLRVVADDPAVDTVACGLEAVIAGATVDRLVGLRRRAGSADDGTAEQFLVPQLPSAPGDSIQARSSVLDLPRVPYAVSGLEIVGGEFGNPGQPGLDAVEVRVPDPVFADSPDLSSAGLLRTIGTRDGIGEIPLGPPPTTAVLDFPNLAVSPAVTPLSLFTVAVILPGSESDVTAVALDTSPAATVLIGDSSVTRGGLPPATPIVGNAMLRLLLDGDRATLEGGGAGATASPGATLRVGDGLIAIDRWGRRID